MGEPLKHRIVVTSPPTIEQLLAKAVLSLADSAGMPDTFWVTDTRTTLARSVLGVPDTGRYTHAHLWTS